MAEQHRHRTRTPSVGCPSEEAPRLVGKTLHHYDMPLIGIIRQRRVPCTSSDASTGADVDSSRSSSSVTPASAPEEMEAPAGRGARRARCSHRSARERTGHRAGIGRDDHWSDRVCTVDRDAASYPARCMQQGRSRSSARRGRRQAGSLSRLSNQDDGAELAVDPGGARSGEEAISTLSSRFAPAGLRRRRARTRSKSWPTRWSDAFARWDRAHLQGVHPPRQDPGSPRPRPRMGRTG